jgi:DNA-binding transcriptional ArsR family regulator
MSYTSFDHFFTVLSNRQRVRILQLLNTEGARSVSEIATALKIEQSAVSHGLKHLLACHFVTVRQKGKERIYAVNEDTVKPLLEQIEKHVRTYCVEGCKHWDKEG